MIHNCGCAKYAPTVKEAIVVGRTFPCSACFAALDIAEYFQKAGRVYIPKADPFYTSYLGMLGTIWTSGYIAGVRAERAKRKNAKRKPLRERRPKQDARTKDTAAAGHRYYIRPAA